MCCPITGDPGFPGGVGNTQKDPERFNSLYADVVEKVFDRLPDAIWIYRATGRTRRSAPSAGTWPNGASAAGKRRRGARLPSLG